MSKLTMTKRTTDPSNPDSGKTTLYPYGDSFKYIDENGTVRVFSTVAALNLHIANVSNPHSVTKTQVGLENCDNTSDADKPVSTAQQTALDLKINNSEKGANSGVAELDASGLVPTAQLPSYVDDVEEYANFAAFPATGETSKIYVALDTGLIYRWSGSAYVEISASLALGETSATAYRGDRGKIAYDHTLLTNNPHTVTKAQIGLESTSTDNAIVRYDGTTGDTQNSAVTIDNGGVLTATGGLKSSVAGVATVIAADASGGYIECQGSNDLRFYAQGGEKLKVQSTDIQLYTNLIMTGDLTVKGGEIQNTTVEGDLNFRVNDGVSSETILTIDGATKDLSVNTNDLFVDKSTGNVGIGTSSPGAKLEVNSTSTASVRMRSGDASAAVIEFGNQSDSVTASMGIWHNDNSFRINGYNNTARMFIKSTGEVGFGTITPTGNLHIEGTGHQILKIESTDNVGASIELIRSGAGNSDWQIHNDGGMLRFSSGASETYSDERLTIEDAGNVGIGTATPNYKLEVVGDTYINGDMRTKSFYPIVNNVYDLGTTSYKYNDLNLGQHANIGGDALIDGHTTLGSDAPAIKMKKLTGTTASSQGGDTYITHSLTASKIIGYQYIVHYDGVSSGMPLGSFTSGYQSFAFYDSTSFTIRLHATESGSILSKSVTILVTFEE